MGILNYSLARLKRARFSLESSYRWLYTRTYIISFPKSGRTWLRVLLGKVLCDRFDLPESLLLDTYRLSSTEGVLRSEFTHDRSDNKRIYSTLPQNKQRYAHKKVVFLTRGIEDTVVSYYFHCTKRNQRFSGDMSTFVRDDRYGIKKILAFYRLWEQNRELPQAFLLLRYEDFHAQPRTSLLKLLRFLELEDLDHASVDRAIEYAQFENMKKLEQLGGFNNKILQPRQKEDSESYKVRKGQVGGYRQYLSAEDLEYIRHVELEMGGPFLTDPNRGQAC